MSKSDKTIYEIGYNLIPTTSAEDVAKEVGAMKEKITSLGGDIISDEFPNLIKLAYQMIKEIDNKNVKFNSAFFGWIKFDLDPSSIEEINKMADTSDNMLRFIVIKTVRENTMFVPKINKPSKKSFDDKPSTSVKTEEESKPMDTKEVDKKIEEMLDGEEESL